MITCMSRHTGTIPSSVHDLSQQMYSCVNVQRQQGRNLYHTVLVLDVASLMLFSARNALCSLQPHIMLYIMLALSAEA